MNKKNKQSIDDKQKHSLNIRLSEVFCWSHFLTSFSQNSAWNLEESLELQIYQLLKLHSASETRVFQGVESTYAFKNEIWVMKICIFINNLVAGFWWELLKKKSKNVKCLDLSINRTQLDITQNTNNVGGFN
jgi:hypothetical protein